MPGQTRSGGGGGGGDFGCWWSTHRPLSRSFLGLPYRILNKNHKQELLRGPWVGMLEGPRVLGPRTVQVGESVLSVAMFVELLLHTTSTSRPSGG